MSRKVACFFAKVKDREILRRVEFYAQDIKILQDLGFEVRIATRLSEIRPADLYFVWWWTWAYFPVSIARMLRRPVVVTGVFDAWNFHRRPHPHRAMMRYALRHATANVFVSQLEYREMQSGFAVANPHYVPLTVDTDLYIPGSQSREHFILTIGWMQDRNAQRKSMPEVIRAAGKIYSMGHDLRFIIAGERGSYYPALLQLARDAGVADRVQFPGAISLEDKISLMQRCQIYLQPSRFEGFGLAILEAMSCGAPIVTSPAGAVREVVGDAAVMVDGTSPEAIADAVSGLLEDEDRRQALGRQARARAETLFPYGRRLTDLERLVQSICGPL
jgi:glycosyltransferase involved in cell wall biosynthesis